MASGGSLLDETVIIIAHSIGWLDEQTLVRYDVIRRNALSKQYKTLHLTPTPI
jgi:hypothetical protein